jgi:cytochrome c biogenesis protein CcmG, thiol:disulfide interchange protein DsbE
MNGKKIAWIVGGIVVIAGIVAGLSAESGSGTAYGEVAVAGESLPRLDPNTADPARGAIAPTITGEDVSVTPRGTPTIVLFLAHWCPACQREVPNLTAWVEANGMPQGLELIGVATSSTPSQGNFPPSAWLERERFPFPVIFDDESGTAAVAYGLNAFPYWVVLDGDGRVVERFSGALPDQESLTRLFEAVAGL